MRIGGVFGTAGSSMTNCCDMHLPAILALNPKPSAYWMEAGTNILTTIPNEMLELEHICNQLLQAGMAHFPNYPDAYRLGRRAGPAADLGAAALP
jgi:hypothetical protein